MTPPLNEIIATHNSVRLEKSAREAMIAVIKTHIVPMVVEAFAAGDRKIPGHGERPDGYAARIEREIMGARDDVALRAALTES